MLRATVILLSLLPLSYALAAETGGNRFLPGEQAYKTTLPHEMIWKRTHPNSPGNFDGECLEVDSNTKGLRYSAPGDYARCQKQAGPLKPVWSESASACFLVDKKTGGNLYSEPAKNEACHPKDTVFVWDQSTKMCREVDAKTKGKEFWMIAIWQISCAPNQVICSRNKDGSWTLVDAETRGQKYSSAEAGHSICGASGGLDPNQLLKVEEDRYLSLGEITIINLQDGPDGYHRRLHPYVPNMQDERSSTEKIKDLIESIDPLAAHPPADDPFSQADDIR